MYRRSFALLQCTRLFLRLLPLFFALGALGGKEFIFRPRLEVGGLYSPIYDVLIRITVCASRVIPFEIIIASEIVWPPAIANYLPFSNHLISQARGSAGSYGPIILTVFSLRSIFPIALYLANICCSMVSAYTCLKPVS